MNECLAFVFFLLCRSQHPTALGLASAMPARWRSVEDDQLRGGRALTIPSTRFLLPNPLPGPRPLAQ